MNKKLTTIDEIVFELSVYQPRTPIGCVNTYSQKSEYSLDRWARAAIDNIALQLIDPVYITEKQGNLALKIIRRYRKQLYKQGYDVKDLVKNPVWKGSFRIIDYTKSVTIEDGMVILRFPYNADTINHVKKISKTFKGTVNYKENNKTWHFTLMEDVFDPEFILYFIESGFAVSDEFTKLHDQCAMIRDHSDDHLPILDYDGELKFVNCHVNLITHFKEHVSEVYNNDLYKIVDRGSDYGLTIGKGLKDLYNQRYGKNIIDKIVFNKMCELDKSKVTIKDLIQYIKKVDCYPVFFHIDRPHPLIGADLTDPSPTLMTQLQEHFDRDEIGYWIDRKYTTCDMSKDCKIYVSDHAQVVKAEIVISSRMPTTAKNHFDKARKIVYYY